MPGAKASSEEAGTPVPGLPGERKTPEERPGRTVRWVAVASVVTFVLGFASVLAFGFTRDPRVLPSSLVGRTAPGFTLREMATGRRISLGDFRGQAVVLNFWASWCAACREEHPGFVYAWNRYRDSGVIFLGIVFQDTPQSARQYMEEMGGDWPNLLDPSSRTAIDYGVYGVPETFFIAPDGTVAHKVVGATSYVELVRWIERLLAWPSYKGE
jgi:cytochrome c biogenesis protein CcmG, thiol:disulfide interchange protein DsbE